MSRSIEVMITGDADSLSKAFGSAQKSATSFGSKVSKAAGLAGAALGGALAIGAKVGFSELAESQKVGAQTEAVLKSTGAAANLTGKQVEGLAGSLSRMSGVDDEAIQSGENLLLTFTRVRNEVGKGNDVFNQATTAALNMSVAMGTDMSSASMLVGKALNDPIKGMTALTRAGVQFTDAQKASIAAMVASGDTMGAQKIILKELETQFGGSAKAAGETLPGQMAKARVAFENVAGELVASLLPALTALAQAGSSAATWMGEHEELTKKLVVGIAALSAGLLVVSGVVKAWTAVQAIARAATVAWTAAQWLLNVALTANPIGLIIVGIAALAVGLVVAWQRSERFREIVTAAFEAVKGAALSAVGFILGAIDKWLGAYQALFEAAGRIPGVGDKFDKVAGAINRARDKIDGLKSSIDSLRDKTVTVTVVQRNIRMADEFHHRAAGGPVSAGGLYMVGERGPEMFSPRASGSIIPNRALSASAGSGVRGGAVEVHFHGGTFLGGSKEQLADELADAMRGALIRIKLRSGTLGFN